MRPLGLGHFTFLSLPPAELVRMARAAGFDMVGLRFHPVAPGQKHWLPDGAALVELGRVLRGENVALYDVEAVVIDASLAPEALVPMMDAAAELGGRRINTCADRFDGLQARFAEVCSLARERGLGVDIECMPWRGIDTPQACLDLIAASGAENAGYLVDALHHTRCGGAATDLAGMDPRHIASVQLCDAPATGPNDTDALIAEARGGRLLPGQGGLPLSEIVAALPDTAIFSVEIPSATDTRPALDRARAIHAATAALFQDTP